MNVLETVKILFRDYPITHINYESIQAGKGRDPYHYEFNINNITYSVDFEYYFCIERNERINSNRLVLRTIIDDKYVTIFTYDCNDYEKSDIMVYAREAEINYYNNLIKKITVHPLELCNTIDPMDPNDPNVVDVTINPDMIE